MTNRLIGLGLAIPFYRQGSLLPYKSELLQNLKFDSTGVVDTANKGTTRPLQQGRCYLGDGVDDFVTTGASGTSITGKVQSTTAWVKISSSKTAFSYPFGAFGAGAARLLGIMAGASADQIWITYDNATPVNVVYSGLEDAWHHIAVIYDGADVNLYIDGVFQVGSTVTEMSVSTFDACLIARNNGNNPCLNDVYDARFYTDEITMAELTHIYTHGRLGTDPGTANLVAQYKCDEQSGIVAYDSSGNANDGTITNATLSTFHATQDEYSFQNQVGFSGGRYLNDLEFLQHEELSLTGDFTLCGWFNFETLGMLFTKLDSSNDYT